MRKYYDIKSVSLRQEDITFISVTLFRNTKVIGLLAGGFGAWIIEAEIVKCQTKQSLNGHSNKCLTFIYFTERDLFTPMKN